MLIETTIGATLMFCTVTRRMHHDSELLLLSNGTKCVQIASGKPLEARIMSEIEDIQGVRSVSVIRNGDNFSVSVVLEDMEFSRFEAVAQKEVELYSKHPDLTFNFTFVPVAELEEPTAVNAA